MHFKPCNSFSYVFLLWRNSLKGDRGRGLEVGKDEEIKKYINNNSLLFKKKYIYKTL